MKPFKFLQRQGNFYEDYDLDKVVLDMMMHSFRQQEPMLNNPFCTNFGVFITIVRFYKEISLSNYVHFTYEVTDFQNNTLTYHMRIQEHEFADMIMAN